LTVGFNDWFNHWFQRLFSTIIFDYWFGRLVSVWNVSVTFFSGLGFFALGFSLSFPRLIGADESSKFATVGWMGGF
jgi:hypothetical protein